MNLLHLLHVENVCTYTTYLIKYANKPELS